MSAGFSKTIGGDFDRVDIEEDKDGGWVTITMRVGYDVERRSITFRSAEAVRDLHYALGRYLAFRETVR